MESSLLTDEEWRAIDGEPCRVIEFTPAATIKNGEVISIPDLPYAAVTLECRKLPPDTMGFITHKQDFQHLWSAFMERGVTPAEEVIIFWVKSQLNESAKLISAIMPRLCVMVCKKGAYDLMSKPDCMPELQGRARFLAQMPIVEWKPDVMR